MGGLEGRAAEVGGGIFAGFLGVVGIFCGEQNTNARFFGNR